MMLTQQMLDDVTFINVGFIYSDCVAVYTLYMHVTVLSVQFSTDNILLQAPKALFIRR